MQQNVPLYAPLQNDKLFHWSSECQIAFEHVKQSLCTSPILHSPSSNDYFILETDASDIGLGGCLKCIDHEMNNEYIVGYCSSKFNSSQLNWNIVEKESYSVLHNVRHFRHYLIWKKFTIR